MDKEGGIGTYSSPNESPDRVKEEEKGQVIGQNPKAEVAPFSSADKYLLLSLGYEDEVVWWGWVNGENGNTLPAAVSLAPN